ncbi:MAG: hypothetical protein PWQ71_488 [Bacteroidota bacterium]|jgi:hypothetical protein|nr:hypothetical protein [Bacteroidota bacterium]
MFEKTINRYVMLTMFNFSLDVYPEFSTAF